MLELVKNKTDDTVLEIVETIGDSVIVWGMVDDMIIEDNVDVFNALCEHDRVRIKIELDDENES